MRILVINGPNLNMLGIREKAMYGTKTYGDLVEFIKDRAGQCGLEVEVYQSNHEGEIVDKIQSAFGVMDGIVINAGAYTHTSLAILDALKAVDLPTVEVHLTDIQKREPFRQFSYVSLHAKKAFIGEGFIGYQKALQYFVES